MESHAVQSAFYLVRGPLQQHILVFQILDCFPAEFRPGLRREKAESEFAEDLIVSCLQAALPELPEAQKNLLLFPAVEFFELVNCLVLSAMLCMAVPVGSMQ